MFGQNSIFVRAVERIADIFWLNIMWLLGSCLIFTIGASTTALYYVTLKMVNKEDTYLLKSFIKAYKENFVKSTTIWVPTALLGAGVFVCVQRFHCQGDFSYKVATVILLLIAVVLCMISAYVYPLLAKYDNTILNTIKNAALVSVIKLPKTIVILIIIAFPYIVMYTFPYMIIYMLIFGGSVTAYAVSMLLIKIFNSFTVNDSEEIDS